NKYIHHDKGLNYRQQSTSLADIGHNNGKFSACRQSQSNIKGCTWRECRKMCGKISRCHITYHSYDRSQGSPTNRASQRIHIDRETEAKEEHGPKEVFEGQHYSLDFLYILRISKYKTRHQCTNGFRHMNSF